MKHVTASCATFACPVKATRKRGKVGQKKVTWQRPLKKKTKRPAVSAKRRKDTPVVNFASAASVNRTLEHLKEWPAPGCYGPALATLTNAPATNSGGKGKGG